MKKRIFGGVLWTVAIFVLVVGRRVVHAIDNPDYSVAWFVYALGIGGPALLLVLPRIVTAVGIDFSEDKICLRYLQGRIREYDPSAVELKSRNRSVAILEGTLLDGSRKTSYLLSGGFAKPDWRVILARLECPQSIDQAAQEPQMQDKRLDNDG
ncbi:MAG: hypothetical protein AAGD22_11925 [Verrucomicrobiota bacterium]